MVLPYSRQHRGILYENGQHIRYLSLDFYVGDDMTELQQVETTLEYFPHVHCLELHLRYRVYSTIPEFLTNKIGAFRHAIDNMCALKYLSISASFRPTNARTRGVTVSCHNLIPASFGGHMRLGPRLTAVLPEGICSLVAHRSVPTRSGTVYDSLKSLFLSDADLKDDLVRALAHSCPELRELWVGDDECHLPADRVPPLAMRTHDLSTLVKLEKLACALHIPHRQPRLRLPQSLRHLYVLHAELCHLEYLHAADLAMLDSLAIYERLLDPGTLPLSVDPMSMYASQGHQLAAQCRAKQVDFWHGSPPQAQGFAKSLREGRFKAAYSCFKRGELPASAG